MTFSKDGKGKLILCLANHLKKLTSQRRRKKISPKSTLIILERNLLPMLGRKPPHVVKIMQPRIKK